MRSLGTKPLCKAFPPECEGHGERPRSPETAAFGQEAGRAKGLAVLTAKGTLARSDALLAPNKTNQ
eukprot:CAMPEP_0179335300 /NCGR_PEP_ID=MMETSP0797-20121207/66422_1 /TAXON_ID=47934 /ORGANISM="Dinophysis acuminata, Strain DAEP01" /LENGTH=65 /DNA_ID=CAMNT_0021048683 /DNA_START=87 /DNA_END=281 /DNA_ORIENTATION=-